MNPHEIFTSLDLEMNQPSQKIIQIGACVGNIRTGEILDTLKCYIHIDESLSDFISTLTSITDFDLISKGVSLLQGYDKLKEMHLKHKSHPSIIQWGGGDIGKLKTDLINAGLQIENWIFGYRCFDVKTVYQSYCIANNMKLQSGLAKSMTKLGLRFIGTKHDALDDCVNTFQIFHKLLQKIKNAK